MLSSLGTSVLCFIIMVLVSSVIIFLLKWWCLLVMYIIMDLINDISSEHVALSLLPKSLKDSISSSMTESQIKVFDYTTNIIIVLVILYYLTVVFHSFFHSKDYKNNKAAEIVYAKTFNRGFINSSFRAQLLRQC